jgi:hypothetical protein
MFLKKMVKVIVSTQYKRKYLDGVYGGYWFILSEPAKQVSHGGTVKLFSVY